MNDEKDPVAELLRIAGPRPKVADEVKTRVFAAVHDEWQQAVSSRRRNRIFGASGLAAAAAAVVAFLVLRPAPRVIETTAEPRSMTWGAANLRVDPGTRVRLESDRIAILEKGTIFVSTTGSGVEIRTPFGTVRDIGTQFEVRVSDDDLRVRVQEGRVEVRGTIVDAGAELFATKSKVETLFTIEGLTLEQVVDRVAREKGLTVEWSNASAKTKRLHGRVPLSPDEALDAAAAAAGVRTTIANGHLVIR